MWRSVGRASGMPRPAKPARQTEYARRGWTSVQHFRYRTEVLPSMEPRGRRPRGCEMRAWLVCRAGFAGRGIPVARPTERDMLASHPDPRRSLGSVS